MAARRRKSGPAAGKKKPRKAKTKGQIDAERRKRFVDEYLIDGNATQAAIRAGYSKRTAHSIGSRLLTNVEVAAAIEAGRAELARKCRTTAEWARLQLRQFVEANMLDFAEWDNGAVRLRDSESLPRELGACIQEIKQTADGVQIKLIDRRACIADLRALDGLDEPKRSEVTGAAGGPIAATIRVTYEDREA